ncbi:MAG: universal stress protein [Acidobacteriota bacterium]
MRIQKILMPTDFSECSKAAFDHALFLAQKYGAELHLFHAVELNGRAAKDFEAAYPSFEEISSRLDAIARSEMGKLIDRSSGDVLHIREVERSTIAAAPSIVHYAKRQDVDLIVMGTHGLRGFRRWLLGSVTEEVLRTAPCPVLTIRDDEAAKGLRTLDRILVPFDFSPDAQRSLEVAKVLAGDYGGSLDVAHITAPLIAAGGVIGAPIAGTAYPDLSEQIMAQLELVTRDEESELTLDTHVLVGPVAWRLVELAEEKGARLIVIATRGLGGVQGFLLGGVTERVVRSAPCPVLVLRHGSDAADTSDRRSLPAP